MSRRRSRPSHRSAGPAIGQSPNRHPVYRWSGIGRAFDAGYTTHRVVLALMVLAFVGGAAWGWMEGAAEVVEAAGRGVMGALVVFLSWALARELAPDAEKLAFVAVAVAASLWALDPDPSLWIPGVTLLAVRLVNRSTGKAAEPLDSAALTLAFTVLAWVESWTLGLVGGAALLLDGAVPAPRGQPRRRVHLAMALLPLTSAAAQWSLQDGLVLPPTWNIAAAVAGAALLVALFRPAPVAVGDVDQRPLEGTRVRLAALLGVLAVVVATVDAGAIPALCVGWGAVAALVIGAPAVAFRRSSSYSGS